MVIVAAQLPLSQVWCAFSPASERKRTPAMNCSFSKEALVMMPVEPVMSSGSMYQYQGISAIFNEPTKNGSVEFGFLMSLSLPLHQSCLSKWLWVEVSRLRLLRSWRLQVQPFPAKFYPMSVRDCIWKKVWIHVDSTMFLVPGLHSFITNGYFHRNSLVLAGSSAHLLNGRRPLLWPASNFIKNAGSLRLHCTICTILQA